MSMPVFDSRNQVAAAVTLLGIREDFSDATLPSLAEKLAEAVRKIETMI